MEISGTGIAVFVVCMLFVVAVYFLKAKKHGDDTRIDIPGQRKRRK